MKSWQSNIFAEPLIVAEIYTESTPAMSAQQYPSDPLELLLKEISLVKDEVDHEKVLKLANQSLKTSKGDITALQTKIVALLHLDRHEDALKVFKGNGGSLEETAQLELGYCVYKTGDLKRATELAEKSLYTGKSSRAFKHIAAQAVGFIMSLRITPYLLISSSTTDLKISKKQQNCVLH